MKKNYATALDYLAHRLDNKSTKYDKTVSSYVAKMVKKVKSEIKANFVNLMNLSP